VAAGDFVALLGPSGSGKSSLLHVLGGLDTDYEGDVTVLGEPLRGLSDARRSLLRNQRIGFVFQSFHLVPTLTAAQNVALPAIFAPDAVPDADARARAALVRVGLGEKADRKPTELSGGERQRVAIARALFSRPPLLLCDEPTGNLDDATGQQIVDLFKSLNAEDKVTLVVVTHSTQVAQAARRVLRLQAGQIVEGAA
jgi:putative ABC transport system ATP-binding protein